MRSAAHRALLLLTAMRQTKASEGALHRAADVHVPSLEVAFRHAFAEGRKVLKPNPLKNIDKAVEAIQKTLSATLPNTLRKVLAAGGGVAAARMPPLTAAASLHDAELRTAKRTSKRKVKIDFAFNAENQSAIDWADRHAAELIDGISETSREAINNAIADALESGDLADALDEILAAVGDTERARLIARNETMRAVSEGQRQAWAQAVDEGFLTGDERRTWITVGDEKVCPICEPLDGRLADLDGTYPGGYDGPPAHVSCRCTEGLA